MKKSTTFAAATALAAAALLGTVTIPAAAAAPGHAQIKTSHKPRPSQTPTSTATPTTSPTTDPTALPRPDHVVIAVFENHDYSAIAGSPTFSSWAQEGALLTDSHGVTHPSEPNYLALWSGSTQGITDDSCPHTFTTPTLGSQLGENVAAYSEDLPSAGDTSCTSGEYARKHNPLANWSADNAHSLPWTSWPSDYSTLPEVSLVVPNLCDDMHDCSVATGDAWLSNNLTAYKDWAKTHNSLLIVTFDEDSESTPSNQIYTFMVGQHVKPGSTYSGYVDHYGILHTIEQAYGVAQLGPGEAPVTGIYQ